MRLFFVLLYFITEIIYLFVGFNFYFRDWKNNTGKGMFILSMLLAGWAGVYSYSSICDNVEFVKWIYSVGSVFWNFGYAIVCHGCFDYIVNLKQKNRTVPSTVLVLLYVIPTVITLNAYGEFFSGTFVKTFHGWKFVQLENQALINTAIFNAFVAFTLLLLIPLLIYTSKRGKNKRTRYISTAILISTSISAVLGLVTDVFAKMMNLSDIPSLAIVFLLLPYITIAIVLKKYSLYSFGPESFVFKILNSMNDALVMYNAEGNIEYTTGNSKQLLDNSIIKNNIKNMYDSKVEITREVNYMLEDNSYHCQISIFPLTDKWNEFLGALVFLRDVTELRKAQLKLEDFNSYLEKRIVDRTKELIESNDKLRDEMEKRINTEKNLYIANSRDFLTGLINRQEFSRQCESIFSVYSESEFVLIYTDLDAFKAINDTLGHLMGDKVINELARRISSYFSGISSKAIVSRFGGDEFLILLEVTKLKISQYDMLKGLYALFTSVIDIDAIHITTDVSIGVARFPQDGEDISDLIRKADMALHVSKVDKSAFYTYFSLDMQHEIENNYYLSKDILKGIEKNEFEMYYQPQVFADSNGNTIKGFEALIRWNHPTLGFLAPFKFISIAENFGIIGRLGDWIIENVCTQTKLWNDSRREPFRVAINLSANQLIEVDFLDRVKAIIKKTGVEPSYIELEITETVLLQNITTVVEKLKALKMLGFKLSIDDFGTEYSSLNYLQQLPIDKLKIAINFTRGIGVNSKEEAIIKALIGLTKDIGIEIIAEGVETEKQLQYLIENGCNLIQGYYFYKPLKANDIELLGLLK